MMTELPTTPAKSHGDYLLGESCAASPGDACRFQDIGRFPDRSGLVGGVSVDRCARCGLGVSRPPIADVAFLYADRSSQDFQPGTSSVARFLKQIAFRWEAERLLRQVGVRPLRVIDFGCGSGLFTHALAEALPDGTKVTGTDFHPTAPAELGDVAYAPMASLDQLKGSADLVTSMHVIEHDDDPGKVLDTILSLAKPGASVVIEVPNIDCFWTGVFGAHWDAWYLPYHRIHFSRASFRHLAESRGLTVVSEIDVSVPSMGRTIANMLKMKNSLPFILLSALLNPVQLVAERMTRRPTALRIVARKA